MYQKTFFQAYSEQVKLSLGVGGGSFDVNLFGIYVIE